MRECLVVVNDDDEDGDQSIFADKFYVVENSTLLIFVVQDEVGSRDVALFRK